MKAIPAMKTASVKTGIQSDVGASPEGVSVLEYGSFNEFGTRTIPARPYIRGTTDQRRMVWLTAAEKMLNDVITGKRSLKQALEIVGQLTEKDIKVFMTNLQDPPNAPSTAVTKGSSNPLIDNRTLINSIRYQVEGV